MKIYDKIESKCAYGQYEIDKPAGYTITEADKLKSPWYYVYNNRKLLLYVDQNGPEKIQHQPPQGIFIFRREFCETQSRWQVWVKANTINGGVPVSNFNSPKLKCDGEQPKYIVEFTPEVATYISTYQNAEIKTEIFMPIDKATVCMKTTIKNTGDKAECFSVVPAVAPYVNVAQMVAWDLPEWYLSTSIKKDGKKYTICGQMSDPLMIKENERVVTFNLDYDKDAQVELSLIEYSGNGSFFQPQALIENKDFSNKMGDDEFASGGKAVWACKYNFTLEANQEKTFTQVMTVQEGTQFNAQENQYEDRYFSDEGYNQALENTTKFYNELFSKRMVKTNNQLFDKFLNEFTPLQMYWVCSLDRGWPSSMRGTRDASQDFVGMTPLDPKWTKQTILQLFEHQQLDGWMPRQISTISRTAPHDMRYFSDGGAFLLELIHEYLTFTRDKEFLSEEVVWLDSDEKSTVLEHIERCIGYYLDDRNIGEHGLCKAWYGDWWDVMDKIGTCGIGESVTVTAQNVLNLKNLALMIDWLIKEKYISEEYLELKEKYLAQREKFIVAMNKHAYNKLGYYNGYYNDNRKWLLSDNDPDGVARIYLVSNAWAIISGVATPDIAKSVIANVKKENFGPVGYNTQSKAFKTAIDKAGRVGNGTKKTVYPYNHAQSFYVRACCVARDAEEAYNATRYILPIEQEYAPVEKTYAPPYAIANCYSLSHRAGFQFLSGTVSYVLRNFYNFFFGITYCYDGLVINPCLSKEFGDCQVKFSYLDKNFTINYYQNTGKEGVVFNGKDWKKTVKNAENGLDNSCFADEDLDDINVIDFFV